MQDITLRIVLAHKIVVLTLYHGSKMQGMIVVSLLTLIITNLIVILEDLITLVVLTQFVGV